MSIYLHSKYHHLYRPKYENLLIEDKAYLKLTDFGFAKYLYNRTYSLLVSSEYTHL